MRAAISGFFKGTSAFFKRLSRFLKRLMIGHWGSTLALLALVVLMEFPGIVPDVLGNSEFLLPLLAALISTIVAISLPRETRPVGLARREVPGRGTLSRGGLWLLCFLVIVGPIYLARGFRHYAELEQARLCADVTKAALKQPVERTTNIQCRLRQ